MCMCAMVTTNINAGREVANGVQGNVIDLILDQRKPAINRSVCKVELKYSSGCVLVKLA